MTIRPPRRERARLTFVPRERRRSSSTRSSSGSVRRVGAPAASGFGSREPADQLFGLTDGQLLTDHRIEDAILQLRGQTTERPPVALAEPAVRDRGLHTGRQVEEAECVRDCRSCATDAIRDLAPG